MSFFVVLAEDWCAAVPHSWVDKEGGVYWWPKERFNSAVIRQHEPDSTWNSAPYQRVLGPYGTLREARAVEIRMAEISTEDEEHITWATEGSRGKRRVKKRNFNDYVLERDCEVDDVDEMPPPPSGYKPRDTAPDNVNIGGPLSKVKKVASETRKSSSETIQEVMLEEEQMEDPQSMPQQATTSTFHQELVIEAHTLAPTWEETVHVDSDLSHAEMMKKEFRSLHARIDSLETKLDILLNQQDGVGRVVLACNSDVNVLPSFPLNSINDLKKLEGDLKNSEEVRKQLKLKIKVIGGVSGEQHSRRALSYLLSNKLAYQLTWMAPQHGSKKRGLSSDSMFFGGLKLCDILLASVMECHPTTSNIAALERAGKQWLQHAGDRIKYAEKKSLKES